MVYLIDASVYIFRAWYAQSPPLHDAAGNPTHALYGFARFLSDLIERRVPRFLAVAFDESRGSGHRHALLPSYKANREPAPPELKRQFALCREFCRHLGVAEFASSEYEADDLIGTLAVRARDEGLRVTVVTRDKDLSQLVGRGDRSGIDRRCGRQHSRCPGHRAQDRRRAHEPLRLARGTVRRP